MKLKIKVVDETKPIVPIYFISKSWMELRYDNKYNKGKFNKEGPSFTENKEGRVPRVDCLGIAEEGGRKGYVPPSRKTL